MCMQSLDSGLCWIVESILMTTSVWKSCWPLCCMPVQVERSVALLNSLGNEKQRWEAGSETFKQQMATIIGDVLLSAAFMAYAGNLDVPSYQIVLLGFEWCWLLWRGWHLRQKLPLLWRGWLLRQKLPLLHFSFRAFESKGCRVSFPRRWLCDPLS